MPSYAVAPGGSLVARRDRHRGRVRVLAIAATLSLFVTASAGAAPLLPKFSLDPASPSNAGGITPDDVLVPGPAVLTPGVALGLIDLLLLGIFDNLDALSYGMDPITTPLYFSVDRVAVGAQGSAVNGQARPGRREASGDVYRSFVNGTNTRFIDEQALGLQPGFFGDDLDAVELDSPPIRTYFSIDGLSASNGFGAATCANDIFLQAFNCAAPWAAGEGDIGLDPFDDLDALVLLDLVNPGILDPGVDLALFSLSKFSPSTFTFIQGRPYQPGVPGFLSPSDVLFTRFQGNYQLFAPAPAIGLRPDDELDALDTAPANVPEPGVGLLLGLALAEAWRRKRARS